jgi:hypothetical protein
MIHCQKKPDFLSYDHVLHFLSFQMIIPTGILNLVQAELPENAGKGFNDPPGEKI